MIAILELRERFYSETNIDLDLLQNWEPYAKWLESLAVLKINTEVMNENKVLRDAFFEVSDILEQALVSQKDIVFTNKSN